MFKNYFTIVYRNFLKSKTLTLINILSLAIGMVASLFIFMYVAEENSYDAFHENAPDIYRIILTMYRDGKLATRMPLTPCPMGPELKNVFPEVREFARITNWGHSIINYKDRSIRVIDAYCAEPTFLTMFSYPMVRGNPSTALSEPFTAVISESLSKKIFAGEDPMDKSIVFKSRQGNVEFVVRGVFKDPPENSHLEFDLLFTILFRTERKELKNNWTGRFGFNLYLLLHPDANPKELGEKITKYLEKKVYNIDKLIFTLQPLRDIHLHSDHLRSDGKRGSYKIVYFFAILGVFILIIAWVNYIIIVTARSMSRAGEVGIRKVVGATRKQLIQQFLFESVLFNLIGAIAALILVQILLPTFNNLFNLNLSVSILGTANVWIPLVALLFVGSILSALYPAFILSSYKPLAIMKGKLRSSTGGKRLSKVLAVFQIVLAVGLIGGTLVVGHQINYMEAQHLGVNLDQVLLILNPTFLRYKDKVAETGKIFKEELVKVHSVKSVSSSNVPGEPYYSRLYLKRMDSDAVHHVNVSFIDFNFFDTYEPVLLAGRNFSREFPTDQWAVLINEKSLQLFEFATPEKALNQFLQVKDENVRFKIIGVVKNHHQQYLKEDIVPLVFRLPRYSGDVYLSVKLNTKNIKEAIDLVKDTYQEYFPDFPFEYMFANEFFDRQYSSDKRLEKMVGLFSLLAIFIACIGLYALALHNVAARTKEIGIRKVVGATFSKILILLSKDYILLVALGNIISLPLAYWATRKWLENYAYRIEIGWWFFVIPLLIVLGSTFLTVSYQVFKIARSNPVDSLRYE